MDVAQDTPEIAAARRAYNAASQDFEEAIARRDRAVQTLAGAQQGMADADSLWENACGATNRAFDVLRRAVEAAREVGV